MRASAACVAFVLFAAFLALAQGYDSVPDDALIVRFGESGSGYELLEAGTQGGRFITALMIATGTWNPVVALDGGSAFCTGEMHRGLVGIHPMTGVYFPELAKSWSISEDGLTLTFHLREGIRWSDGAPFTADDVLFTYNDLILNNDVNAANRDNLRLPDGTFPVIDKLDTYTVRIVLSTRFRPALNAFTAKIVPEHVLAADVHKRTPEVAAGTFNAAWNLATPGSELVGLGPFVLKEFKPDEYAWMERNPFYHHYDPNGVQLPYVDELLIMFVADRDVALLKFLNGEFHSIEGQAHDVGLLMAEAASSGYTVRIGDVGYGSTFFTFNLDCQDPNLRGLFRNLSFRQAMSHATDTAGNLDLILGIGDVQWSPISMASPYYAGREVYGGPITEADAILYEYDLQKAAELLDACGIVDRDGDGIREFEDGSSVKFELVSVAGYELAEQTTLVLAEDLGALGIRVHVNLLNFQHLVGMIMGGQWEAMGIGMSGEHDPHGAVSVLHSTGNQHFWHYSASAGDLFPYEQEIDRLMDLAAGIYDPQEAFEYYKQVQLIFAREDLGMIFGVNPRIVIAVYNVVGNQIAIKGKGTPYGTAFDMLFFKEES